MTENILGKTIAVIVTAGTVLGVAYGAAKYVTDFEAAKIEISNLRGQITQLHEVMSKLQSAGGGVVGPQGDKGEKGDKGERGIQGEMGPMGPSGGSGGLSEAQIRQLVQQLVQQQLASMPSSSGTVQSLLNGADVFQTSGCINLGDVRNLEVLTLRPAQEFCDQSGRLVGRVRKFSETQNIYIERPGDSGDSCSLGYSCKLRWLNGKTYTYERYGEDENGPIALLRLKT